MISRLRGDVIENHGTSVVVECSGVGYDVQVPTTLAFQLVVGAPAVLWIRHIVREDDQTLYGFSNPNQRRMFDMLRDVKGCGPKTSLAVLSELGEDGALSAILHQDVKGLTRVSGVGLRLAERVIVELKDKVSSVELDRKLAAASVGSSPQTGDDLVDALIGLGYRRSDAENAAVTAREEAETVQDQLRIALRSLTR